MKILNLARSISFFLILVTPLWKCYAQDNVNPQVKINQQNPSQPANITPAPGRDAPLWGEGSPPDAVNKVPVVERISKGVLKIGNITVNKNDNTIKMSGVVNMQEGLVEYLACSYRGKLHESVLALDVEPFHLQIALLLMGFEPGDNRTMTQQGARVTPQGDPLEIWVSWKSDGKEIRTRGEDLVFNIQTKKTMEVEKWVFVGSRVENGVFMAQMEQSIVATYHDPFAIIDHTNSTGSDDQIFHANLNSLPAKGTPVVFEIRPKK